MSEIPETVWAATKQVCHDIGVPVMSQPFVPSVAAMASARAIMAERERCAGIAEDRGDYGIASAIRRGE